MVKRCQDEGAKAFFPVAFDSCRNVILLATCVTSSPFILINLGRSENQADSNLIVISKFGHLEQTAVVFGDPLWPTHSQS